MMQTTRLLALLALLALPQALHAAEFHLEDSYRLIRRNNLSLPVNPRDLANKIEVVEFFSYSCQQCPELHALLHTWKKSAPDDVLLTRVPFIRKENDLPFAQIYYTLIALRKLDQLHDEVYRAYQEGELNIRDEQSIAAWAENQHLDPNNFIMLFNSPGIYQKAVNARLLSRTYDIRSAPSLVVANQFVTSTDFVDTMDDLVTVMGKLVEKVRNELNAYKPKTAEPPAQP